MEEKEYVKPKLKTPPPPEIAYLDLDAPLFAAASAGERVVYAAVDPEGSEVGSFKSAKDHKKWLEDSEEFGCDIKFGYGADLSGLTRETRYEVGDFEECIKAFDSIIGGWIKRSGCKDWVGYVSKATGAKNFRYDVATIKPYKGGRKDLRKPHYLEELRKHVAGMEKVKTPRGPVEVDDVVAAMSQRKRWKGCVVGVDKDANGVENTHVFIPEEMDAPRYSSNKVVGRLFEHEKTGKIVGRGTLFWLYQALYGDTVDNIGGCKGVGSKGAYKLLREFDGVCSSYLKDAVRVVAREYHRVYGEAFEYEHHETGEPMVKSGAEVFEEMSHLVYMKKSLKDECFWVPLIYEVWEEILQEEKL